MSTGLETIMSKLRDTGMCVEKHSSAVVSDDVSNLGAGEELGITDDSASDPAVNAEAGRSDEEEDDGGATDKIESGDELAGAALTVTEPPYATGAVSPEDTEPVPDGPAVVTESPDEDDVPVTASTPNPVASNGESATPNPVASNDEPLKVVDKFVDSEDAEAAGMSFVSTEVLVDEAAGAVLEKPRRTTPECWRILRQNVHENIKKKNAAGDELFKMVLALQKKERELVKPESTVPRRDQVTAQSVWTSTEARRAVFSDTTAGSVQGRTGPPCVRNSKETLHATATPHITTHRADNTEIYYKKKNKYSTKRVCCGDESKKILATVNYDGLTLQFQTPLVIPHTQIVSFGVQPLVDQDAFLYVIMDGRLDTKCGSVTPYTGTLMDVAIYFKSRKEADRLKESMTKIILLKSRAMTQSERALATRGTRVYGELCGCNVIGRLHLMQQRAIYSKLDELKNHIDDMSSSKAASLVSDNESVGKRIIAGLAGIIR